jgi:DNA helicase II / ATP-dependent DNA helicase PcrA
MSGIHKRGAAVRVQYARTESGEILHVSSPSFHTDGKNCPVCGGGLHYVSAHGKVSHGKDIWVEEHLSHNINSGCTGEGAEHIAAKEKLAKLINADSFSGLTCHYPRSSTEEYIRLNALLASGKGKVEDPKISVPVSLYRGNAANISQLTSSHILTQIFLEDLSEHVEMTQSDVLNNLKNSVLLASGSVEAIMEPKDDFFQSIGFRPDIAVRDNTTGKWILGIEIFSTNRISPKKANMYLSHGFPVIELTTSAVDGIRMEGVEGLHVAPFSMLGISAPLVSKENEKEYRRVETKFLTDKAEGRHISRRLNKEQLEISERLFGRSSITNENLESEIRVDDLTSLMSLSRSDLAKMEINKHYAPYGVSVDDSLVRMDKNSSRALEKIRSKYEEILVARSHEKFGVSFEDVIGKFLEKIVGTSSPGPEVDTSLADLYQATKLAFMPTPRNETKATDDLKSITKARRIVPKSVYDFKLELYKEKYESFRFDALPSDALRMMPYEETARMLRLSLSQRKAACHLLGPAMVVSTAGSGKTTVLAARSANLLHLGVDPRRIVAITFTKAARESLTKRISNSHQSGKAIKCSTFHAFANRYLCRKDLSGSPFFESLEYRAGYSMIADEAVQKLIGKLLYGKSRAADQEERTERTKKKKELAHMFVETKWLGLRVDLIDDESRLLTIITRENLELFRKVQFELRRTNTMTYEDMIINFNTLMKMNGEFRNLVHGDIEFLMVDEFQDCNIPQYEMAYHITEHSRNLMVVGDDDQAIYGWRGAAPTNLKSFENVSGDVIMYALEENYRSTKQIVAGSAALVARNKNRVAKNPYTKNPEGIKIQVNIGYPGPQQEAEDVVARIKVLLGKGVPYNEIAILVRRRTDYKRTRSLLIKEKIPYVINGGDFFEEMEIKAIMAILRAIANPKELNEYSDMMFVSKTTTNNFKSTKRLSPFKIEGIGETLIESILDSAAARGENGYEAGIRYCEDTLSKMSPKAREKSGKKYLELLMLYKLIERLSQDAADGVSTVTILETLLNATDFYFNVKEDMTQSNGDILELIKDFLELTRDFGEKNPGASLSDFVGMIEDVSSKKTENGITLSTIHGVKGLEYLSVFILAACEGIFPSPRASGEEERRLMFVAMTRAKQELWITHFDESVEYGQPQHYSPSQFLGNIPQENTEVNSMRTLSSRFRNLESHRNALHHPIAANDPA